MDQMTVTTSNAFLIKCFNEDKMFHTFLTPKDKKDLLDIKSKLILKHGGAKVAKFIATSKLELSNTML